MLLSIPKSAVHGTPILGVAWLLTQYISPRDRVRIASTDPNGAVLNEYASTYACAAEPPLTVWAVNLADDDGLFRLIAFDFDAGQDPARAAHDADGLSERLERLGIEHVLCASGPSGGRHIWLSLAEPATPDLVKALSIAVKRAYPSLDRTPLTNPATGCCRPPGAPHRNGGVSTVIRGHEWDLASPWVTVSQLLELTEELNREHPAPGVTQIRAEAGPLPVDAQGHLYLPGPRRALPTGSQEALNTRIEATQDASTILWTVLIGAAAARWHYNDVLQHLRTAPGLEHARTLRGHTAHSARRQRPRHGSQSPEAILAAEWRRAVTHVATTPRQAGEDPTFEPRAQHIAELVETIQERATASPGRWNIGGGPADRRVLDALCLLALQAVQPIIEADIRRLALITGIGRETARTSLIRLSQDGWITRTEEASGPHGANWTIDPQDTIHNQPDRTRPQAVTRAEGAGAAHRNLLLTELTDKLHASNHDALTGNGSLSLHLGNVYAFLTEERTLPQLTRLTGQSTQETLKNLSELQTVQLIKRTTNGWTQTSSRNLDLLARNRGTAGRLNERAKTYLAERILWAWWQQEHQWMTTPGSKPRRTPLGQTTLALGPTLDVYPVYPRSARHRADHHAARQALKAGALQHLIPTAA